MFLFKNRAASKYNEASMTNGQSYHLFQANMRFIITITNTNLPQAGRSAHKARGIWGAEGNTPHTRGAADGLEKDPAGNSDKYMSEYGERAVTPHDSQKDRAVP